eukprot:Lithocolla_globosa_v1_NODE_8597_length_803_cov_2.600267.p2 type:complete len:106 gc:universal NODE_8597_length_803_cov_2.600267:19-336(+)
MLKERREASTMVETKPVLGNTSLVDTTPCWEASAIVASRWWKLGCFRADRWPCGPITFQRGGWSGWISVYLCGTNTKLTCCPSAPSQTTMLRCTSVTHFLRILID